MSDLTQAIVMSGGFFALMLITQFGTRTLSMHRILMSLGVVAGVGFVYLERKRPATHTALPRMRWPSVWVWCSPASRPRRRDHGSTRPPARG